MRDYPESEKGKELFNWLSGFVTALADAGSPTTVQTMDQIGNLICDIESEVRQDERTTCMQPNPNSTHGLVECCILRPNHHPKVHFHFVDGGTVWRDEVVDKQQPVK
jgi:hypothetical protein